MNVQKGVQLWNICHCFPFVSSSVFDDCVMFDSIYTTLGSHSMFIFVGMPYSEDFCSG